MSIVLSFRGPSSSASPAATQVTAKRPGIRNWAEGCQRALGLENAPS